MDIEILKKQYNKTLEREKRAEKYIEIATAEEFEKWAPEFNKIVMQLSQLMKDIKKITGREMTKEEVFNGFKGEDV